MNLPVDQNTLAQTLQAHVIDRLQKSAGDGMPESVT